MAYGTACTPKSVVTENWGQLTCYICNFASSSSADLSLTDPDKNHIINWESTGCVWTSYIPSIVGYWFQVADTPTQTKEGVDVSLVSASTGRFRFTTGEKNREGKLFVLSLT